MAHTPPDIGTTAVRRCACIDCGTNSIKLVVAEIGASVARPVFEISAATRIGEGMRANGMRLREAAIRRTLDALESFAQDSLRCGVDDTLVIGTAALRDAANAGEFVRRAYERTGLTIEIISGEEEARLSFLAVRRDPHWTGVPRLLVIDVGGGSTEIIQGEGGGERIRARVSVNLGAVKLTESCLRSDPPTVAQLAAANRAASAAFGDAKMIHGTGEPYHVVGVGGTLNNLGAMYIGAQVEHESLHGLVLPAAVVERISGSLALQTILERRARPGLNPDRADIILAGAILVTQALAHVRSDRIDVCTRGLRWGLLYDRFMPDIAPN